MTSLDKLFNENYFRTKGFEHDGKIYERAGIKIFKKMIMYLTQGKKVDNYNLMQYSIEGLKVLKANQGITREYIHCSFFK